MDASHLPLATQKNKNQGKTLTPLPPHHKKTTRNGCLKRTEGPVVGRERLCREVHTTPFGCRRNRSTLPRHSFWVGWVEFPKKSDGFLRQLRGTSGGGGRVGPQRYVGRAPPFRSSCRDAKTKYRQDEHNTFAVAVCLRATTKKRTLHTHAHSGVDGYKAAFADHTNRHPSLFSPLLK